MPPRLGRGSRVGGRYPKGTRGAGKKQPYPRGAAITIPCGMLKQAGLTEREALIGVGCGLYDTGKIMGASILDVGRWLNAQPLFIQQLAGFGVCLGSLIGLPVVYCVIARPPRYSWQVTPNGQPHRT